MLTHPNCIFIAFSTDYISARRGCWLLAPQIFTRAINWPRHASAPPGRPYVGLCPIFLVFLLSWLRDWLKKRLWCPAYIKAVEIGWFTQQSCSNDPAAILPSCDRLFISENADVTGDNLHRSLNSYRSAQELWPVRPNGRQRDVYTVHTANSACHRCHWSP